MFSEPCTRGRELRREVLNVHQGHNHREYQVMDVLGIKTSAGLIEYAIKHHIIAE